MNAPAAPSTGGRPGTGSASPRAVDPGEPRRRAVRVFHLGLSLVAATATVAVCFLEPYGPTLPLAACALLALLAFAVPDAAVGIVVALLPVADLTAWTGMLYLPESDLVVGAVVSGALLRFATLTGPGTGSASLPRSGALWLLFGLVIASYAMSCARLLTPFPALDFHAMSGYASPFNCLRLVTSVLTGLALVVVLRASVMHHGERALARFQAGVVTSVAFVCLVALWERLAFTGFSDFATDYRTTSSFWEMHLGGAQFDGWLAMTIPFVLWSLVRQRTVAGGIALGAVALLAAYGVATTFSRGLYGAMLVEIAMLVVFAMRRGNRAGTAGTLEPKTVVITLVLVALIVPSAFSVFAGSGYRGLAALLGVSGLALAAAPATTSLHRGAFLGALAAGLFSGWVAGSLAPLVPKGPYVAYGLAAAVSAGLLVLILRRPASSVARGALVAMVAATAMLAASVSGYWGGDGAVLAARVGAGLAMAPLFAGRLKSPSLYRNDVPTLAFGGLVIGLLGVVVIFGHSYFVDERMATVTRDSEGRIRHWSDSLALLSSDLDWAMGIGPGRFAVDYFWKIPARLKPGDFRIVSGGAGKALRLSGPSAPVGWGEIFRVSQQVDPALQLPVAVQVRAAVPAGEGARSVALHLEICRKMLLYNGACAVRNIELTPGERDYVTVLDAKGLGPRSVLGIPVPTAFALGLDSTGGLADILSIQATDGRGHALLRNGEFSENGAWWFFSSDRFHLPYHAKNLWLQFLVEQGIPGVTAITLLGGFAILWLAVGPGRGHPAAAPWLAGLIGFGIVGLTDTIVDAPRLATLMYLMCGGALSLRAPPPRAA